MKRLKQIIFISILLISCGSLKAQKDIVENIGDIEVSKDFTAMLTFSDDIKLVLTANNPQLTEGKFKYYDIFQSDKICIIKGNDPNSPQTAINVILVSGKAYVGTLKYGINPSKLSYNLTLKNEVEKVQIIKDSVALVTRKSVGLEQNINSLLKEDSEYSMFGIKSNRLIFQVTNIRNDSEYTYFKIVCDNQSGSDYNIDNMLFKYQEGKKKGSGKNAVRIEERIMSKYESPIKTIKAYSKVEMGYVIPLFTVGEKGNLIIQMMESSGTRNPKITILGEDMLKVKVF